MATEHPNQEARSRRGEMINRLFQSVPIWRVYRGLYTLGIRYIKLMTQRGSSLFTSQRVLFGAISSLLVRLKAFIRLQGSIPWV